MLMGLSLAALASVLFNAAVVLQAIEAREVPAEQGLRLSLLVRLARRPRWLGGIVLSAAAVGLQTLALTLAPLTVCSPRTPIGILIFSVIVLMQTPAVSQLLAGEEQGEGARVGRLPARGSLRGGPPQGRLAKPALVLLWAAESRPRAVRLAPAPTRSPNSSSTSRPCQGRLDPTRGSGLAAPLRVPSAHAFRRC